MKNKLLIDSNHKSVTKEFRSKIACAREAQALRRLSGTGLAPELLHSDPHRLTMTLCAGEPLSVWIEHGSPELLRRLYRQVTDQLLRLAAAGVIQEDVNPGNFLYDSKQDRIYCIDLEDWHPTSPDDPGDSLAALLAMIRMTRFPTEEIKESVCASTHDHILAQTHCAPALLDQQTAHHLEFLRMRRRVMPQIRQTDCVILAGGKSSRMGTPKALLPLGESTFLDHMIHTAGIFDRLSLSANDPLYDDFRCPRIPDIHREIGPLGAIHAALTHASGDWVFLLPCDMPLLRQETILQIFDQADWTADCNLIRCGDHDFPTVALYHKRLLPQVEQQILTGNYRLMRLLDQANTHVITLKQEGEFQNINSPEDYLRLLECGQL